MEDGNEKNYHGFIALPRQSILLRQVLGPRLFCFYLMLILEAKWSRRYKSTFGKVMMNQAEIAKKLQIDQGTVSKNIKELNTRNRYCVIRHKGNITLGYFPLFMTDVAKKMAYKNYANLHELYADMHKINADIQDNYEVSQDNYAQNTVLKLKRSFNDNVSFSPVSNDYYDEIDNDEIDKGIEKMINERNDLL